MNDDNNLDLLDLDDTDSVDALPDVPPFVAPRPKKPWLLLSVGVAVIILATYIIVQAISDDSSSTIEVDLDVPVEFTTDDGVPVEMNVMPPVKPVQVAEKQDVKVQPKPQVVQQPKEVKKIEEVQAKPNDENAGIPVRVVEERKEVKFNPAAKTDVKPRATEKKTSVKTQQQKKTEKKTVTARTGASSWYVQFGSYSTRALAEAAQRKITNEHKSLFAGKQFVILAAQLKNGTTTYRLRVGFATANDANGFCRNAKSDGLDCYVAK